MLSILLLLSLTAAIHAACLWDGSILDDHWHQKGLREHGWSYAELMRSLEIEPADFQHLWWQDRVVRWDYGRPLFILAMKFVYVTLGGCDPFALHLFSLLLHAANVLLVAWLAERLTRRPAWGLMAGLIFAVYPHTVITVAWPSSQNAVIVTFLMLVCMLLYMRASQTLPHTQHDLTQPPPSVSWGWLVAALLTWILALGTRENALAVPVILALLEWRLRGVGFVKRRLAAYAAFAFLGLIFVTWRLTAVTTPMPDVYVRRPDGDWPEYAAWLAAKLLHYIVASIWIAPMTIGPTGRFNPWTEATGDCLLMLTILAVMSGGYAWLTRGTRAAWVWPAWVVLAVLPVVPMIATPHSGYIPGVGFALAIAVAGAAAAQRRHRDQSQVTSDKLQVTSGKSSAPIPVPRSPFPIDIHSARTAAWLFLIAMTIMSLFNRWQWEGIAAAERMMLHSLRQSPPEPAVTDVYFINLPFANIYAKPSLDRTLGPAFDPVRVHVLAYAPDPLIVGNDVVVEQRDDFTLRVTALGRPFFERLLGRFLIEAFRQGGPFRSGDVIPGRDFDVTIVRGDAAGVWSLDFTFARSLDDPSQAFYVSTPYEGATRLRFACLPEPADDVGWVEALRNPPIPPAAEPTDMRADGWHGQAVRGLPVSEGVDELARLLRAGHAAAAEPLFDLVLADAQHAHAEYRESMPPAREALHEVAQHVAGALAAPEHFLLAQQSLTREEWEHIRRFWRQRVDDQVLGETFGLWETSWRLRWALEEVPNARMWAARVIHTDLYLTGPPFPGPRERP